MNLIFSRATEAIDIDTMKRVADNATGPLGIAHQLITEPFGDYSPDVILPRLSDLRQRFLDEQDTAVILILFDKRAVESHGATVLGRAVAQSRVAVVRWRTEPETTVATCLHELGHILGLTNRHCDREDCIMYPYAREITVQGRKGRELFCEDCWRTISTDTLYESVRNASQPVAGKLSKHLKRIRNTITSPIRPPQTSTPIVNQPKPFPTIDDYPDGHRFLHAVLQYYGIGKDPEEAEA